MTGLTAVPVGLLTLTLSKDPELDMASDSDCVLTEPGLHNPSAMAELVKSLCDATLPERRETPFRCHPHVAPSPGQQQSWSLSTCIYSQCRLPFLMPAPGSAYHVSRALQIHTQPSHFPVSQTRLLPLPTSPGSQDPSP